MNGSTVKNHVSFQTGFGYPATRRTSFLLWFMVNQRVLSSSSLPFSTSMTPSRQEIDHPKSSSCSSTSAPMTSSTLSSDSVIRRALGDLYGRDHHPAAVSSERVERQERKKSRYRNGRKNSEKISWMTVFLNTETHTPVPLMSHLLEPTPTRSVDMGKHCIFTLISIKTEIERSVRGPRLQGHRAEDAMAEQYVVQKIFGDLITADHKVLIDNCESRNNHRYAVVVQDLATQWIQAYP